MIILKGSRRYIQSLGNDFWLVWKGFISHVNEFTRKNNNASELLRDIDILIGTILEKEAFVSGSPIFNKNGDVVGVLHGSLEYRIPRKQGSIGVFIRSEYVLKFLTNIE